MKEHTVFYYHPTIKFTPSWFDLNGDPYRLVGFDHAGPIDFCCTLRAPVSIRNRSQVMLDLAVFHNYENQGKELKLKVHDNSGLVIITNLVDPRVQHKNIVFSDFLFNRTKAYYSQYPFGVGTRPWYHDGEHGYINIPLQRAESKQCIFVSACRTYHGDRIYRTRLFKLLENYKQLGYLGNGDHHETALYAHSDFPGHNLEQLESEKTIPAKRIQGYRPPHNEYYKNTFISIYGETIEFGSTTAVTEKTWDPLIKGHFILPFSNAGFVGYLYSIGIQFPDFIDYSYDTINDDEKRFAAYSDEVKRLLALDLDSWRALWDNNLHILLANKRYFYNRDYHRIDLEQFL